MFPDSNNSVLAHKRLNLAQNPLISRLIPISRIITFFLSSYYVATKILGSPVLSH